MRCGLTTLSLMRPFELLWCFLALGCFHWSWQSNCVNLSLNTIWIIVLWTCVWRKCYLCSRSVCFLVTTYPVSHNIFSFQPTSLGRYCYCTLTFCTHSFWLGLFHLFQSHNGQDTRKIINSLWRTFRPRLRLLRRSTWWFCLISLLVTET